MRYNAGAPQTFELLLRAFVRQLNREFDPEFGLVSVKRNTFAVGFLTAAAIWLAWFAIDNFRFQGGYVVFSVILTGNGR